MIDSVTSNEVVRQMSDKVYKQLELVPKNKMIQWNSVVQTTAKRFVTNAVEEAIKLTREKLLANEHRQGKIIIQRLVLDNNLLKIV